jgi:hypothetical protein
VDDHIQTLFGPSEDGYELPPDPEPGDDPWRKLTWVLYPLMVIAIFTHGALSQILNKIFWTLFVMGLLVTSEWSQLEKTKTRLALVIAGVVHLCLMTLTYDLLPEHRRLTVILFVSVLESVVLGVSIKLLSVRDDR